MWSIGSKRAGGYGHWFNGNGPDIESDTFTCFHCGNCVFVPPMKDPAEIGGWCLVCMKLICQECVGRGECRPFEKQLDQHEARERRAQANLGYHR